MGLENLMRRLPSLNALRAFEAAARHQSFTRAADELHVTQGAVSHQVKGLEAELGLKLFRRHHQHLTLTESGQACLPFVRDAFDRPAAGFAQLRTRERAGALTDSVSPNFPAKWLVHRLGRFTAQHPEIDLRIGAATRHIDFARDDVDLVVRHGDGRWPGLHVVPLTYEELFPVCSPALAAGRHPLRRPTDLAHHTLLHLDNRQDWVKWLQAARVDAIDLTQGPVFDQASLAIDAAVGGQGVALARTALAAADLLAGRLTRPFALGLPVSYAYYIICPAATAERTKIARFRAWLLAEAAADAARLAEL
jgi:LysR family glycine cleavage system transcriptional activator